eukprot:1314288-Pyramimonas_sp.AAC.1
MRALRQTNGALPRCPVCEKATLKAAGAAFKCPGYYDADAGRFLHCKFAADEVRVSAVANAKARHAMGHSPLYSEQCTVYSVHRMRCE